VPELRGLLRNPQIDTRQGGGARGAAGAATSSWFATSILLLPEEPRGEVEEIAREFDRAGRSGGGHPDVELTTAVELSEQEARDVIGQIAKASGRKGRGDAARRP